MIKNRIARITQRIVNKIARKRIAMEQSKYDVFDVIDMAQDDDNAELFILNILDEPVKLYRKNYSHDGHLGITERIYAQLSKEEQEKRSKWDMYDRMVRGYWLPERNEMYFHLRIVPGGIRGNRFMCPDSSIVAQVLRDMNVEPESIYCFGEED